MCGGRHSRCGFTIVELVMVIVVLGILSLGAVRFLTDASNGFASTVSRSQLARDLRQSLEDLSRGLREALPGSVRVDATGRCLELIPVLQGGTYLQAPIGTPAGQMRVVPTAAVPGVLNPRAAISPLATVYTLGGTSVVSPPVTLGAVDAANELSLLFAVDHAFPQESATQRYYLVADPESYCFAGGALWRYSGYGWQASQPGVGVLPAGLPGRALVVPAVDEAASNFTVSSPDLSRNALVKVHLAVAASGDTVAVEHRVRIRNRP